MLEDKLEKLQDELDDALNTNVILKDKLVDEMEKNKTLQDKIDSARYDFNEISDLCDRMLRELK